MLTEICLVRHGQTNWGEQGLIAGCSADITLSSKGQTQVAQVAAELARTSWQAIYSSPVLCTAATAQRIAEEVGLTVGFDARLEERDYGLTIGMSRARALRSLRGADLVALGIEPAARVHERALNALGDIAARHAGGRVVVVTHAGVITTILEGLQELGQLSIDPTRVYRLIYDGGAWQVAGGAPVVAGTFA